MTEQPDRKYVAITMQADPLVFLLGEEDMPRKRLDYSFIFHSWLHSGACGVIGVKFSSWMIKHGKLTPAERSVVSEWNRSESDFEVFFGKSRDYDHDKSQTDETGAACLMRLASGALAVCFPIFGSTLGKRDSEVLAANLADWTRQG